MILQTEYEFTLPRGYADEEGNIHRRGAMRLVTAIDEIEAAKEARVRADKEYMPIILLSRVITKLEEVECVTPRVIERLFPADYEFLQNMYETVNNVEEPSIQVQCPYCKKSFTDTLNFVLRE